MQFDLFSYNQDSTEKNDVEHIDYQRNFKVYTASAGSGKTFQLTLDYLKLALRNPTINYRRILAITFTNKAANEMKSRIVEAAKAIAKQDKQPLEGRNLALFEQLVQQTEWTEQEIQQRATILFQEIIHNYSDFSISTIDSFAQRIVQSFAFELNIPMNFIVEIDKEETIDIIIAQLLNKVGVEKELSKLIGRFFETKLIDNDSVNIQEDIINAANAMLDEESQVALEEITELSFKDIHSIYDSIQSTIHQLRKEVKEIHEQVFAILDRENLVLTDFKFSNAPFLTAFTKAVNHKSVSDVFKDRFMKAIFDNDDWFSKTSGINDENFREEIEQLGQRLYDIYPKLSIYRMINLSFPKFALIAELFKLYKAHQQQENVVLIDEVNNIISKEVKNQPAPFLYEKIGEQYQHLLIDEFQDTSKMQWHNILPIITENLSRGGKRESLVVGDAKQAIYQFRGGKVEQLPMLPKLLDSENDEVLQIQEAILEANYDYNPLKFNYRSRKDIVEFNNQLFTYILEQEGFTDFAEYYRNHQQKPANENEGYVHIEEIEQVKYKHEQSELIINALWDNLNNVIERYPLKDIAVICPRNHHLQLVANLLMEKGVSFTSKKSLLLKQAKHIRLFSSLVQLLVQPRNQIAQAEVANGLIDVGILDISRHLVNQQIARKRMKSIAEFSRFINSFNADIDLNKIEHLPLLSCFETYVSWLPHQLQISAYTAFFRDQFFEFIQQNGNDLHSYIHWWMMNQDKLYLEMEGEEGVQLLTIHSSKGLEFEVVFLPFLSDFVNSSSHQWVNTSLIDERISSVYISPNKQLEKTELEFAYEKQKKEQLLGQLNAVYVAVTRPVSELYLYIDDYSTTSDNASIKAVLSDFMKAFPNRKYGNPTHPTKDKEVEEKYFIQTKVKEIGQAEIIVQNRANVIWNDEIQGRIDFGEIIHSLLEQIQSEQDINLTVEQAIAAGYITENEQEEITNLLEQVISHKELNHFFAKNNQILAEQHIITPDGQEFVPDRLLIDGNEVRILEFKTGQSNQNKHKQQLLNYAELLEQMKYNVIEKKLVYVSPLEIKNL